MKRLSQSGKGAVSTAALLLVFASFLLFRSKEISAEVSLAVDLCLDVVIPSLLGMMIVSDLLVSSGMLDRLLGPFSILTRFVFKLPSSLTGAVFFGMIGGYPVGARLIEQAFRGGKIDRETAERALSFCVNAGPAFLVSAVSVPVFGGTAAGWIVFFSHFLANVVVALLGGIGIKRPGPEKIPAVRAPETPLSVKIVSAVERAARSLFVVCSFIVAFSLLSAVLRATGIRELVYGITGLNGDFPGLRALTEGLLEVTRGCSLLEDASIGSICLFSGLTSFGGVCVHTQISALVGKSGLRIRRYLLSRLIHLPVSVFFSALFYSLRAPVIPAFSPGEDVVFRSSAVSPFAGLFLIFLCFLLLFAAGKPATIEKERENKA